MDEGTRRFYAENAKTIAARYEAAVSPGERFFATAFPPGGRILDVGAGSGRDLACLLQAKYDAYGIEPSEELRQAAIAAHPELTERIGEGALPVLGNAFGGSFDGILCCAVLMHIPQGELFDTAFELRRLLTPHGRLLVSLPSARTDVGADERDDGGRLFKGYTAEYIQLLFERIGFQQIGRWATDDVLGRAGTAWYTLLFELRAGEAVRAVDQIEGILNRDRKVATYKLALFRALAELALREPHLAVWRPDGRVGVPLSRVAERWLMYYWPIFASATFIPQSQAEGAGERNPVAFRAPLRRLMEKFAGQGEFGGLTAWYLAWASARLDPETQDLARAALRSIAGAIRTGPVAYSGGSLDGGRVFQYEAKHVLMSAELWRELSLLGHWILDAVVVRWAQLTETFAYRQGVHAGHVLPLLLAQPEMDRVTRVARDIFIGKSLDRCVWSDRHLKVGFAVDHVIPFALWGSNDLWNLVPADAGINNQKSDKLPTAELLRARQMALTRVWQASRDAEPTIFDREATHLLGRRPGGPLRWEEDLFARVREAVEVTALQRGVPRWAPGD